MSKNVYVISVYKGVCEKVYKSSMCLGDYEVIELTNKELVDDLLITFDLKLAKKTMLDLRKNLDYKDRKNANDGYHYYNESDIGKTFEKCECNEYVLGKEDEYFTRTMYLCEASVVDEFAIEIEV